MNRTSTLPLERERDPATALCARVRLGCSNLDSESGCLGDKAREIGAIRITLLCVVSIYVSEGEVGTPEKTSHSGSEDDEAQSTGSVTASNYYRFVVIDLMSVFTTILIGTCVISSRQQKALHGTANPMD